MAQNKARYHSLLAVALAAFVASPLDDIILTTVFGSAFFGFGSVEFYLLLVVSSSISVLVWKRRWLATHLKHNGSLLRKNTSKH